MVNIPKVWLSAIEVPYGVYAGRLAKPCFCGNETTLEQAPYLIAWPDGELMFCHQKCVPDPEEPDAEF